MNIVYDVTFMKTPCAILIVDSLDALGSKIEALKNSSKKIRLESGTFRQIEEQQIVLLTAT